MNTNQLESFIQVAEYLNFARAAEALNLTTSAVSRQIRSLEEELNTTLLHRTTKNVALTPAGIIFYNDAKDILAKLKLAARKIKDPIETNIQIISLGYTDDADPSLMVQLLRRCREQMPDIHPFIRIVQSRLLLNMLIHDEIDILFGFKDNIPMRENFVYSELAQIPVCCVLPSGHPLARKDEISEEDLLSENIVICNSHEIPLQAARVQNMLFNRLSPEMTYYSDNLQAMLTLIKAGYGIGVFPEMPATDTSLVYVPLSRDYSMSYGVFYKDTSRSPVLKRFLRLMNIK